MYVWGGKSGRYLGKPTLNQSQGHLQNKEINKQSQTAIMNPKTGQFCGCRQIEQLVNTFRVNADWHVSHFSFPKNSHETLQRLVK